MSKVFKWYNIARLFSFAAMFMIVCGGRGLGKTYAGKKYVITRAIKKGEQFIYLRRFKSDLRVAKSFFADIAWEFPEWEFKVEGATAKMRKAGDKEASWRVIGAFVSLTNAQNYKSGAYPDIKTIIFDEFILEKGFSRYIDGEYEVFLNFYNTIDRWQDKTKVLFFANAVSIDNPYFNALNVRPTTKDQYITGGKGYWVAHFPDAAQFAEQVFATRFGQFIKDTNYAAYAVGNEFADNHDKLIKGKTSQARYEMTIITNSGEMSIWRDWREGVLYIRGTRPKDPLLFTTDTGKVSEEVTLLMFSDRPLAELRTAYRHGRAFFDSPPTRNKFLEVFKK